MDIVTKVVSLFDYQSPEKDTWNIQKGDRLSVQVKGNKLYFRLRLLITKIYHTCSMIGKSCT